MGARYSKDLSSDEEFFDAVESLNEAENVRPTTTVTGEVPSNLIVKPSLEDLLKDIPCERLNQPCRDDHLNEIALSLTDWQSIAPFLELTEFDEREITMRYSKDLAMQNIAMLRKWRSTFSQNATYKTLVNVLWNRGKTSLAEQVCAMVSDWKDTSVAAKATQESTLDSYADYLRGRYSTEVPKFFTLQWPPPPTCKVFNLAIIGHETIQRGPIDEELVRLTLRGNVDDIMRSKSSIELKNLFKLDKKRRKIILIEGAPGAGKSTLAWHICQTWESGELFQEFKVVVFVQLRDSAVQSATSLADVLPAKSMNMRTQIVSQLECFNGRDVLFVLDGWDEYGGGLSYHSVFQRLICSPEEINMRFSSLIITSRPIASGELQRYASSRVEIIGFTSAEVKKYFYESIGDSKTEHNLHEHLRERPVIEASCYLPLNAAIVVHLFLALNHTLPHTLHEVFVSVVLCCIIRHLTRQVVEGKQAPDISSLDNLPPDIQEPFNNICAMAFHGVMENKATFSATDLQSFNLPTEVSTLSLIQGVQSFVAFKASISCNFLHLSVQELLGAFHISKLGATEQIIIFNDLFDQPRLAAVFQFYAAFTKLQTEGIRDIVARIVQKKQKPLLVNLLHGLYEAQDPSLCEFVASHLKGELDLYGSTLSPMDCLVVGYFLSCVCLTTSTEFIAKLSNCSLNEYRVSFLVKELSSRSLKPLLTLDLRNDHLSNGVVHIAEILIHGNCVKRLDISNCRIDDQGMMSLASALERNGSLEELNLRGNIAVTGVGHMALGESLKRNRGLKTLNISYCCIDDQGVKSLASALETNSLLEELDLSENHAVTGIGLMSLGESLKGNRGLKTLNISCCGIDYQGMKSLASALEMNGSLEELDLSENRAVTGIGHMALGESLKRNRGLKTLNISHCCIDDQGMKSLASALEMNGSLEELNLRGNRAITGIGHLALGESLKRNRGLKTLNISYCYIDDQGVKSLASALEMNGSLDELNFSGNDAITGVGFMALGALKTLNISYCCIDDQGMKSLASTLEMNGSLEELNLRGTGAVTGIGHMALGESLKRNRGLKTLNISYCSIDDQGVKSLASALEMNGSLEELNLSGNRAVTVIGLKALGNSLKSNRALKTLYLGLIKKVSDKDWRQFIVCLQENNDLTKLELPDSSNSTCKLVQLETNTVNQIRRQKRLPLLVVVIPIDDQWSGFLKGESSPLPPPPHTHVVK